MIRKRKIKTNEAPKPLYVPVDVPFLQQDSPLTITILVVLQTVLAFVGGILGGIVTQSLFG